MWDCVLLCVIVYVYMWVWACCMHSWWGLVLTETSYTVGDFVQHLEHLFYTWGCGSLIVHVYGCVCVCVCEHHELWRAIKTAHQNYGYIWCNMWTLTSHTNTIRLHALILILIGYTISYSWHPLHVTFLTSYMCSCVLVAMGDCYFSVRCKKPSPYPLQRPSLFWRHWQVWL